MRTLGLAGVVVAFLVGLKFGSSDGSAPVGEARAEFVRAALADPDPIARTLGLSAALRNFSEEDIEGVVSAFESAFASAGPDAQALALLSEAWAPLGPRRAYERIESWPSEQREPARLALLQAWARREPRTALQVAEDVEDLEGWATYAAYTGWAESGDPEMWDFVMTVPISMARENASIPMMKALIGRGGFEALLERVEALPSAAPDRFKLGAFRTAASLVADHDPQRALAFAMLHNEGPHGRGLLRRVAVRWARANAPLAMSALVDLPIGSERDWALREAYRTWLRSDRPVAMAWMGDSPPTDPRLRPLLDLQTMALANSDRGDPDASIARAVAWSEGIQDSEKRREAMVKLGVKYLDHAPAAARPWLEAHGVIDDVMAETSRRRRLMGRLAPSGAPPGGARPATD